MSFTNLQIAAEQLPAASELRMEPMAEAYIKEVRLQQAITWAPLLLVSWLPFLLVQKAPLLVLPGVVAILAAIIAPLVIRKSRVKAFALRQHDIAYRSGLYWQKTVLLPFNRVQHAEVSSGPLQRKFGLASLKELPSVEALTPPEKQRPAADAPQPDPDSAPADEAEPPTDQDAPSPDVPREVPQTPPEPS